ncbi:hypothetical protein P154DRAFT_581290 [Amniculicola lignicola CBS 123094]|uniref:Uncharacterized protein n=1 Tax=Amniculicola lignicola CBS 123094 TaxID=1392246 RepID=A0A6A5W768_9PLEO|nr:hypothetical protein P154DRAFT_581290 [Amniculicola lignicola CBS 123094]
MKYCEEYLLNRDSDDQALGKIDLVQMAQYVTLKSSISYLYPDPICQKALASSESVHAIMFIGKRINDQVGNIAGMDDFKRITVLAERKRDPEDPRRNLMNWLLPTYDTMWRVVQKCFFLEIRYRNQDMEGRKWRLVLKRNIDNIRDPIGAGRGAFEKKIGLDTKADALVVSAKGIVKEALRLYPPSRRVHRQFSDDPAVEPMKADIEKCHHSTLFVGSDPLQFGPERWKELNVQYENMKRNASSQEYGDRDGDEEANHYQERLREKNQVSQ